MRERVLHTFLLLVVWGCLISGWATNCRAQADEHVITDIQGQVSVKRARRSKFVPAYIGMFVGNGATFRLDTPGSKASVSCSDGTPRSVERNPFTLQCGSTARANRRVLPLRHNGRIVTDVRSGPLMNVFPVLVSPRMTKLLSPTPIIRWLAAKDATSYKVSLLQGATEIWSTSVGNVTQVQYPHDPKVALVPGNNYRVVISASSHSSTEEGMPNLGFAVLAPAEAGRVRAAEARIRNLRLRDAITRLLVSELYAGWTTPDGPDGKALDAEAIELLEGAGEVKPPALERELGGLYLRVGLTGMAEDAYTRCLKQAQDAGDIENQALAQHALGRIFSKTKLNTDEALQRLRSARELYQSMGDSAAAAEVDHDIQDLLRRR
jgi:hypothetical protein